MSEKHKTAGYEMSLKLYSTEGIHDFIGMLEAVIEDIKGGLESNETGGIKLNGYRCHTKWRIDPKIEEDGVQ